MTLRKLSPAVFIAAACSMLSSAAAAKALPDSFILEKLPADALEVGEAIKSAETGERVVLRGRITEGSDVFDDTRARFELADEAAVPDCCRKTPGEEKAEAHECSVPDEKRATIQFRDSKDTVIRTGLQNKHGLAVGKEVFVVGTVHQADNEKTLVVNATGLHVPEGDVPFGLMLNDAPEDVQDISDAKQKLSSGDEVTIRGRVGGSRSPFIDGRAIFTVVGAGPPACSDIPDDHCSMPWDYCCAARDELRDASATVQLVDENGAPIRTDIKGRNGIKELSDLTVVGTVVAARNNALVVKASGIYVNK